MKKLRGVNRTVVSLAVVCFLQQIYFTSRISVLLEVAHPISSTGTTAVREKGSESFAMIPALLGHPESSEAVGDADDGANSAPGVTGPGIPSLMRKILRETGVSIDENTTDSYAAEGAVNALEEKCEWIPGEATFKDKACFDDVKFNKERKPFYADPSLIDIVTPSIRNLDFLNQWREFFQGFHVIIIQDGDPSVHLEVPEWVDYELYNRNDIEEALGDDQWIISSKDASIRNFGFLVSKKPFIYTIDDDCLPVTGNNGNLVNPIAVHLQNLLAPANPYFFNTLYDPFSANSDFVRGYPYSLRKGVQTAISHGLWLSTPDYDAPTQLLKPEERNTNYVDMTMTIPFKTLYPMCSMNVAFSRDLIGPAFMQGLMGEGQPWARYDDMFAGWASKVIADHLGVGVKSGKPYIYHNKLSNPFVNLKKEYMGLTWQEDIIRFFANEVVFSPAATTPLKAYVELAHQIRSKFADTNPYFDRMAESMIVWTKIWSQVDNRELKPTPSRTSDASIQQKFHPINLSTTSNNGKRIKMFPTIYPMKSVVTTKDIEVGHGWKTYILPLGSKFHEDVLSGLFERIQNISKSKMKNDHLTEYYDNEDLSILHQEVDYQAEVIILKKLLASLNFVDDIDDANLVLIPALAVTAINFECRYKGVCAKNWFQDLDEEISKNRPSLPKKYLYLATQDHSQNHARIMDKSFEPNNIVVTLGPQETGRDVIVPSLNTMKDFQPKNWRGCVPAEKRAVFATVGFGVRKWLLDRQRIKAELQSYNGTKNLDEMISWKEADSIFVLCPPGDLPYQKRFFDALIRCSIPVVVKRELAGIGETYWSNVIYDKISSRNVTASYPKMDFPYSDIVVEVDGKTIDEGGLMEFLERIPMEEIETKLKKIGEVRNRFVYDLDGTTEDAFSNMLETLRSAVLEPIY